MELKFKKLKEDAIAPEYLGSDPNKSTVSIKALSLTQELDRSSRIILVYHTGLSVQIPEGYMGLLFPRQDICKFSLDKCEPISRVYPGDDNEITAKFKINTDSLPTIFQPQEEILQMIIVPMNVSIDSISTEECDAKELPEKDKELLEANQESTEA